MSGWVAGAVAFSAAVGSQASKSAANTQAKAQEQAAQTQQNMFNTINAQEQPFMQAGYGATTALNQLLGTGPTVVDMNGIPNNIGKVGSTGLPSGYLTQTFNPTQDQLNNYPGYQFALKTGGQAVRNQDTPGVGALSGPALKDLTSFNVGMANQNYSNYFNQFQQQQNNIFARLSGIAGLGQNAASNTGTAGTSLGTGIAQAQAAAGGSQAAGTVGAANALGGAAVPLAYLMSGNSSGNYGGNYISPSDLSTQSNIAASNIASGAAGI